MNHEKIVNNRYEKVMRLANRIPKQEVTGCVDADTLVVSWGGNKGSVETAVKGVNKTGKK